MTFSLPPRRISIQRLVAIAAIASFVLVGLGSFMGTATSYADPSKTQVTCNNGKVATAERSGSAFKLSDYQGACTSNGGYGGWCYLEQAIAPQGVPTVVSCSTMKGFGTLDPGKCYDLNGSSQGVVADEETCGGPDLATCPTDRPGTPPKCGAPKCPSGQTGTPPNCQNSGSATGDCTDIAKCDLFHSYINPFIDFLSALVGVAVVGSIIIGGIQYASSAGDPQKVAAAKNRIRNAIIALVTYLFLFALLNFLIPGGLV